MAAGRPGHRHQSGATACGRVGSLFESAMAVVVQQKKIPLPADLLIDAEVDLNVTTGGDYFLRHECM